MTMFQGIFRGVRASCLVALAAAGASLAEAGPVMDRVLADNVLRLGVRTDAPPFAVLKDGQLSGFSVDLCTAVGEAIAKDTETAGLQGTFVEVSAADRFDKLEAGEIDVLCGATTATLARREAVSFTIPTFFTGVGAAVRPEAPELLREILLVRSPAAASDAAIRAAFGNAKLGVRGGTTAQDWLAASGLTEIDGVTVTAVDNHFAGLEALSAGEIDAYFADQAILAGLTRDMGEDRPLMGSKAFTAEPYALAIPRGDEDLRLVLDRALSRLYRSGMVLALFERHFGPPSPDVAFFYAAIALPE